MKLNLELYFTGLIQVVLVCLNTYQISVFAKNPTIYPLLGIFTVGFAISLVWSFNVKKIAFGNLRNRLFYAFGAATGSVMGVIIGFLIY